MPTPAAHRLLLSLPTAAIAAIAMTAAAAVSAPAPAYRIAPAERTVPDRIAIARLDSLTGRRARATVLIFLGAECPLSRNHAPAVNRLRDAFAGDSVAFLGLVPRAAAGAPELDSFRAGSGIRFPLAGDPDLAWAGTLAASVTPEAFLIDSGGAVLYAGALDNWAVALGVKRRAATEHYLRDALDAWRGGTPPLPARVPAVGCRIE